MSTRYTERILEDVGDWSAVVVPSGYGITVRCLPSWAGASPLRVLIWRRFVVSSVRERKNSPSTGIAGIDTSFRDQRAAWERVRDHEAGRCLENVSEPYRSTPDSVC